MSTRNLVVAGAALAFFAGSALAQVPPPHLGKPITEQDAAPWDISIPPDGAGLPAGSGTVAQGAQIYAQK